MTRFHFERPDGIQGSPQTILIHLNEFVPPQGFGGAAAADSMAYEDLDIMGYEPVDWFNALWPERIELTINIGQVPSTQTNFPLLINDVYSDLIGATEAELRFTGADNVQLEYEIQEFDNSTGLLIAWVKKPTVSDGDTLRIYFGNPAAVDEQNPSAVWDTNYAGVYHLNDVGTDSTINAQDLTIFGTTTVPAKIGDGLDFPGTVNDYLIRNPFTKFPTTELTCEYWIKTSDSGEGMVSYAVGGGALANHLLLFAQGNLQVFIMNNNNVTGISLDDGVFHYVVVRWRSSDGQLFVYLDGVQAFSVIVEQGSSFTNNGALVLAQDQDSLGGGFQGNQSLDGILDEVRLSNSFRSADYVTTSFNNQSNPLTFYSTGTVETVPVSTIAMGYEE